MAKKTVLLTLLVLIVLTSMVHISQILIKAHLDKQINERVQTVPVTNPYNNQHVLAIELTVNNKNRVINDRIQKTIGRPTPSGVGCQKKGDYLLVIGNYPNPWVIGNVLWSCRFNIHYDYQGPVVLEEDYSKVEYNTVNVSYTIPFDPRMKSVQLWKHNFLIYSRVLD